MADMWEAYEAKLNVWVGKPEEGLKEYRTCQNRRVPGNVGDPGNEAAIEHLLDRVPSWPRHEPASLRSARQPQTRIVC
jgi:hypothetical protein